jgi:hypothetical protein
MKLVGVTRLGFVSKVVIRGSCTAAEELSLGYVLGYVHSPRRLPHVGVLSFAIIVPCIASLCRQQRVAFPRDVAIYFFLGSHPGLLISVTGSMYNPTLVSSVEAIYLYIHNKPRD